MEEQLKNQKGFTILEVFISFALFAVFATVFLQNQSQNVFDSTQMGSEIVLKQLCEGKMNEVLIDPPEFTPQLDGKKESKAFDYDGFEDFTYTIEYKKFEAPDIGSLISSQAEGEDQSSEEKNRLQILKTVFQKVKEKIETVFWQVKVTVESKVDGRIFELSSWILDPKAKYDLQIPLLGGGAAASSSSNSDGDGQ